MKLALLKGNRFNPWHLTAFTRMAGIAVTAFRAESEIQSYFRERGADTLPFPVEPIYFDYQSGPWWRQQLNRITMNRMGRTPRIIPFHERLADFDCILSWELFTDWSMEAVKAKEKYGIPLAIMVWDNIPFNHEDDAERRTIKERVREAADVFIVHSELSREMLLEEGVEDDRIQKVWPGVDTERFSPGSGNREAYGLGDDDVVLLFVGWLLPRKGIDYLLEAMAKLLQEETLLADKLKLLIVGSGPGRERVDALVSRLGLGDRCVFAGSVPYEKMAAAYQCSDVFVLPSIDTPTWKEQFGMSLMEAMACGLPCAGTRSGAIPEIAGPGGRICAAEDASDLAGVLRPLLLEKQTRISLGETNREVAVERYGLDDHVEAMATILHKIVK